MSFFAINIFSKYKGKRYSRLQLECRLHMLLDPFLCDSLYRASFYRLGVQYKKIPAK